MADTRTIVPLRVNNCATNAMRRIFSSRSRLAESKILAEVVSDHIAIDHFYLQTVGQQFSCHRAADRRLARSAKPSEPNRETVLPVPMRELRGRFVQRFACRSGQSLPRSCRLQACHC